MSLPFNSVDWGEADSGAGEAGFRPANQSYRRTPDLATSDPNEQVLSLTPCGCSHRRDGIPGDSGSPEVFPSEAGPGEANREEETPSGGACQEETLFGG